MPDRAPGRRVARPGLRSGRAPRGMRRNNPVARPAAPTPKPAPRLGHPRSAAFATDGPARSHDAPCGARKGRRPDAGGSPQNRTAAEAAGGAGFLGRGDGRAARPNPALAPPSEWNPAGGARTRPVPKCGFAGGASRPGKKSRYACSPGPNLQRRQQTTAACRKDPTTLSTHTDSQPSVPAPGAASRGAGVGSSPPPTQEPVQPLLLAASRDKSSVQRAARIKKTSTRHHHILKGTFKNRKRKSKQKTQAVGLDAMARRAAGSVESGQAGARPVGDNDSAPHMGTRCKATPIREDRIGSGVGEKSAGAGFEPVNAATRSRS